MPEAGALRTAGKPCEPIGEAELEQGEACFDKRAERAAASQKRAAGRRSRWQEPRRFQNRGLRPASVERVCEDSVERSSRFARVRDRRSKPAKWTFERQRRNEVSRSKIKKTEVRSSQRRKRADALCNSVSSRRTLACECEERERLRRGRSRSKPERARGTSASVRPEVWRAPAVFRVSAENEVRGRNRKRIPGAEPPREAPKTEFAFRRRPSRRSLAGTAHQKRRTKSAGCANRSCEAVDEQSPTRV